ncbi:NALCN channel auxiliary factor 2 [Adelges cooleyi]|uniref:NALCN channel auxiliary factor 2 n=1 Tax=Adelges cooleyi TaxID=133065 RepID=UPI00217F6626|nr:NALCN channel auxiliary factor 2 [Adelges cooleyi]
MRGASTGGGSVCVIRCKVVLAVLVMTAVAATSAKPAAATAGVAAATVAARISAATAAAATDAVTPPSPSAPRPRPPPPPPPTTTTTIVSGAMSKYDVSGADGGDCEQVQVSIRAAACTGQISEGPGPPRCPAPCPESSDINNNVNTNVKDSNLQCLEYAHRTSVAEMCPDDLDAYRRPGRLSRYRLRHCCHHTVESVVQRPYNDSASCAAEVDEAFHMDSMAAAMSCQFNEVLARYDCGQNYSSRTCQTCQDAYALWACSAVLPHWIPPEKEPDRRYRVKSCRSVCLEAEQKCPWLLPVADANPYAGEAAFTCIDPDIMYQMSAVDAKEDCCYEHCGDGLCIKNASLCVDDRSTFGPRPADQRPVCVHSIPPEDEESTCKDYSLSDSAADRDVPAPFPWLLVALSLPPLLRTTLAAVT